MALQEAQGFASFDQNSGVVRIDYSDALEAALRISPRLIGLVQKGEPTDTTEFRIVSDRLVPQEVTAANAAAIGTADTQITLAAGEGRYLRVGALLRDKATGKREVLQVINKVGDVIDVTRGYGSTTAETHALDAVFEIIAMPRQENSSPADDAFSTRDYWSNYTQIFDRTVNLSRNAIKQGLYAVANELAHQIEQRTREIVIEQNRTLIHGIKSASAGSDTEYRTTAGILEFIRTATGGIYSNAALAFTPKLLNDMFHEIWKKGGMDGSPKTIVVNADLNRVIQSWEADKIRTTPDTRIVGRFITMFRNEVDGTESPIVVEGEFPVDGVGIFDLGRIKRRPFMDDEWFVKTAPSLDDGEKQRIMGEWGIEVRNADAAHAYYENVS